MEWVVELAGRGLGAGVEVTHHRSQSAVEERSAAAQRTRAKARSTVAGLKSAEEEERQQTREAARAREQLGIAREKSSRVRFELEVGAADFGLFGSPPLWFVFATVSSLKAMCSFALPRAVWRCPHPVLCFATVLFVRPIVRVAVTSYCTTPIDVLFLPPPRLYA